MTYLDPNLEEIYREGRCQLLSLPIDSELRQMYFLEQERIKKFQEKLDKYYKFFSDLNELLPDHYAKYPIHG